MLRKKKEIKLLIPNNCYCVPQIITIMENLFSLSWFCFVYSECEFVSSWCLHLKEIDFIHQKHWFKLTKSYITTIAYDITKSLYGLWIWFFIFFSLLLFNDSIRLYSFNDFHIELLQQWTRVSRFYSNEIERNREKRKWDRNSNTIGLFDDEFKYFYDMRWLRELSSRVAC